MPESPIPSILPGETPDNTNWLKKELSNLKNKTLVLVVISFATLGVLVGYYLFSDVFGGPFENVTYAAVNSSGLKVEWDTKFPAKTSVEYGTSELYLNEVEVSGTYEMEHGADLAGLLPETTHVFRLVAEDNTGQKHMSGFYKIF